MTLLQADALFDGRQWRTDAALEVDVAARAAWVVPGIANLHSHAFQRAMAGLTERQHSEADSFWTWREWMYRFAAMLSPDDVHVIARQLYVEMLEAGFTSACEFHYLHHDVDGRPYARPAAMAEAILAAAQSVGLRLTLLPVLYQRGGFDGRALSDRQQRFGHSTDAFVRLVDDLRRASSTMPGVRVGVAFHSLRAVALPTMREVLAALDEPGMPVHLHIAEQQAEVADGLATHGRRPVQLLLDELPVDARWTLVHATHLDKAEVRGIAASGATVAVCPTTEANLGDGLFPLRAFLAAGGRYGIGSDSHVSVSPVEDLRWLEYGQRLMEQKRARALLGPAAMPKPCCVRSRPRRRRPPDRPSACSMRLPRSTRSCSTPTRRRWSAPPVKTRWIAGCSAATGRWCARFSSAVGDGSPKAAMRSASRWPRPMRRRCDACCPAERTARTPARRR